MNELKTIKDESKIIELNKINSDFTNAQNKSNEDIIYFKNIIDEREVFKIVDIYIYIYIYIYI